MLTVSSASATDGQHRLLDGVRSESELQRADRERQQLQPEQRPAAKSLRSGRWPAARLACWMLTVGAALANRAVVLLAACQRELSS